MSDTRYVLTKYKDGVLSFSLEDKINQFHSVAFTHKQDTDAAIGDIFVAKVTNAVKHLNAVFIDYLPGKRGYLPLNAQYTPVLVNRSYDGRILAGDEILVQLEKEAVRTKEPVFTINLSLPGKYCVITNANKYKGVSKKCPKTERAQLLDAIPDEIEYGVVVRTNAVSLLEQSQGTQNLQPLIEECIQLNAMMEKVLKEGVHRTCYSRIFKEIPVYLSYLRDSNDRQYSQIITDDQKLYQELVDFTAAYMPKLSDIVSLYQDASYPLQKLYCVETRLQELLSSKVWLKSGAYLVIEKTEAMYVIDVNSGKNISKKTNSQYIYAINIEAATEIMRQIRLRNLTGIILIDFINMEDTDREERLLQELRMLADQDRILTTVVDMTPLGLVEITRKKTTKSLSEQLGK